VLRLAIIILIYRVSLSTSPNQPGQPQQQLELFKMRFLFFLFISFVFSIPGKRPNENNGSDAGPSKRPSPEPCDPKTCMTMFNNLVHSAAQSRNRLDFDGAIKYLEAAGRVAWSNRRVKLDTAPVKQEVFHFLAFNYRWRF
jgi:hypothetical protein